MYKPKNTISYFDSFPQYHRVDLSLIPSKYFGESTKKFRKNCGNSNPNVDATRFYTLNHLVSIIKKKYTPHEILPAKISEVYSEYVEETANQGNRILHYLLSICTREMRHLHSSGSQSTFWTNCETDFGKSFKDFMQKIINLDESAAVDSYMNASPDMPIGKYINGLSWAYYKGKWSPSFGGKKWGVIADCCSSFIYGKTSMEAMIDTGFTLAHNTSPIFNKGMMYTNYDSSLTTILDIQRSGQMPQLMLDPEGYGITKPSKIVDFVKNFKKEFPTEFGDYVDWFLVKKLGAVGTYSHYEAVQIKNHPIEKDMVVDGVKANEIATTWAVWPDVKLPILKRNTNGK